MGEIRTARVRAPELQGRGWLNTGGESYSIKDFRGRIVLLDFWASKSIRRIRSVTALMRSTFIARCA